MISSAPQIIIDHRQDNMALVLIITGLFVNGLYLTYATRVFVDGHEKRPAFSLVEADTMPQSFKPTKLVTEKQFNQSGCPESPTLVMIGGSFLKPYTTQQGLTSIKQIA